MPVRKYRADDPARPLQYSFLCAVEDPLQFVVHEHWATRHHFDLRLELGKVLQDWVLVSKPSPNPKRSVRTLPMNDHDKRCLDLEMRIEAGHYGAGPLLMWDRGTFTFVAEPGTSREAAMMEGMNQRRVLLRFQGVKLKGVWALRRLGEDWRFQKLDDEFASLTQVFPDDSVLTGRYIRDI